MKKRICAILLTAILIIPTIFALTACGGNNSKAPEYYNKTFELTGSALSIDWDIKQWGNNGEQSLRQLVSANFDSMTDEDWAYAQWKVSDKNKPDTVDEYINHINSKLPNFYNDIKGLKFAFSDKGNLQIAITYPSGETITAPMTETYLGTDGQFSYNDQNYYFGSIIFNGKNTIIFDIPNLNDGILSLKWIYIGGTSVAIYPQYN